MTITEDELRCSGCGDPKPTDDFHAATAYDRKRQSASRCKSCRRDDYYRGRYTTTCKRCQKPRPIEADESCRWCLEAEGLRFCRSCTRILPSSISFYSSEKTCKTCRKACKHPLPPEVREVARAAAAAEGIKACEICGDVPEHRPLCVDHSHVDGRVRGMLCGRCNTGLGFFLDNPAILRKAAAYLKKSLTADPLASRTEA